MHPAAGRLDLPSDGGCRDVFCVAPGLHMCTLLQVAFEGQMTELRQLLEADAKLRQLRRQVAQQVPGSPLRRSMSTLARHRVTWTPDMVRALLKQAVTRSGCMLQSGTSSSGPAPAPEWEAFSSGRVTSATPGSAALPGQDSGAPTCPGGPHTVKAAHADMHKGAVGAQVYSLVPQTGPSCLGHVTWLS